MGDIITDISGMATIIVAAMLIVLMAMSVDLASGLYKAKQRGDIRTSEGLKRTLSKFISYEGGMLIAAGVDILMHLCKLTEVLHLGVLKGVPVITCLVGVFLLVVEFLSVRESADAKTKKGMTQAEALLLQTLTQGDHIDKIVAVLTALQEAAKTKDNEQVS